MAEENEQKSGVAGFHVTFDATGSTLRDGYLVAYIVPVGVKDALKIELGKISVGACMFSKETEKRFIEFMHEAAREFAKGYLLLSGRTPVTAFVVSGDDVTKESMELMTQEVGRA